MQCLVLLTTRTTDWFQVRSTGCALLGAADGAHRRLFQVRSTGLEVPVHRLNGRHDNGTDSASLASASSCTTVRLRPAVQLLWPSVQLVSWQQLHNRAPVMLARDFRLVSAAHSSTLLPEMLLNCSNSTTVRQ